MTKSSNLPAKISNNAHQSNNKSRRKKTNNNRTQVTYKELSIDTDERSASTLATGAVAITAMAVGFVLGKKL